MNERPAFEAAGLPRDEPERPASALARVFLHEDLNFLVTNRLPRRLVTRAVGRLSQLRGRRLTQASLAVWGLFADDLRLSEAEDQEFDSLHDVFVRRLKPGARPIARDPELAVSPCDAIIGAFGRVEDARAFQAKGFPYRLVDLLPDESQARRYEGGWFVTLRLKANMYHRFHAPVASRVSRVDYISGDTWNVNPIALQRVESLFCRNERAVLDLELPDGSCGLTLVPVAAIAVASIHLDCIGTTLDLRYRGVNRIDCDARYEKGDELGYFHAGSTILLFADARFRPCAHIREGEVIRMGEPLLHCPPGVFS